MAEPKREQTGTSSIEESGAKGSPSSGSDPASVEPPAGNETGMAAEMTKLRAEKEELLQTLVRRQADFENFRKRTERERHEEGRRGVERLMLDLIPVLDGFDRALRGHEDPSYEEYRKGVILIRKQLWDALSRHGLQRVDAAGKMFDPHIHQAIERVESIEYPDGFVIDVFQDGYQFHGRILRPAIVKVAVHPGGVSDSTKNTEGN
jgi:molecular chaperone GrpE